MDKIFSEKINLLKALAILLVVSGHLEFAIFGMFPPYSFHLALFFFISGMLFKNKHLNDFWTFFKRRFKSLILPYIFYTLFYLLVTVAIYKVSGIYLGHYSTPKKFIFDMITNAHQLDLSCPLWFVTQLFFTMISFWVVLKNFSKSNKYLTLSIFALTCIASILISKLLPHTPSLLLIERTMFSAFFVYLGHFYVQNIKDKHNIFTVKWLGIILCIQAILWLFNRDFDPVHGIGLSYVLVWMRFDHQIIVPLFTSLTGIWFSLYFINIVYPVFKNIKFVNLMGKNTYHIMANHLFFMFIITSIFCHLHGITMQERFANHDIYWIYNPVQTTYLYFVVTMVSTTYIGELLKNLHKKFFTVEAK